jgi:hypothetical protein
MARVVAVTVVVAVVMVGAATVSAQSAPSGYKEFQSVGRALEAHGITACETPDWAVKSATQDSPPVHPRDVRAERSRIVVLAPQACPALDPVTGDVYGQETEVVGVIDVFVFKSPSALKRHAKDYSTQGIGYVYRKNTLIRLNALEPPGMAQAFDAAMKSLRAQPKYVSKLWREAHPPPMTTG